jgi:hypothetical protein
VIYATSHDEVTKERLDKFGEKCISYEQGLTMAKTIKAVRYLGIIPLLRNNDTVFPSSQYLNTPTPLLPSTIVSSTFVCGADG